MSLGGFEEVVSAWNPRGGFEIGGTINLDVGSMRALRAGYRSRMKTQAAVVGQFSDAMIAKWDLHFHGTPPQEPGSTILHDVDVSVIGGSESVELQMHRSRTDHAHGEEALAAGLKTLGPGALGPRKEASIALREHLRTPGNDQEAFGLLPWANAERDLG
jgi:hypothetical protein